MPKISSRSGLPMKRYFRQRAHSNPCADHVVDYPLKPEYADWSTLFPYYFKSQSESSKQSNNELSQKMDESLSDDELKNESRDVSNKESGNELTKGSSGESSDKISKESIEESNKQSNDESTEMPQNKQVDFLDIGCGYGGLLIKLAELFPDNLSLGMEIRIKVCDYVQERIKALRQLSKQQNKKDYQNCACLRTNAMKYLPNYFKKGQLSKMFFLFPDPHFKRHKHKWRIISQQLLGEYAYLLRPGARVYFVTDVKELYDWMYDHFNRFPLFEELSKEEIDKDIIVPHLFDSSEEGQKVTRNNGEKWFNVFKRIEKD